LPPITKKSTESFHLNQVKRNWRFPLHSTRQLISCVVLTFCTSVHL
jgi:hypothetical protein